MSRLRITLQPAVLRWARERAKLDIAELARKVGVRPERVATSGIPRSPDSNPRGSARQVRKSPYLGYARESFGIRTSHPTYRLRISDFRTRRGDALQRPSPDLLETVYLMQRRQAWMHDDLVEEQSDPLGFVAAYGLDSPPQRVAAAMRDALHLSDGWAAAEGTWSDALRRLRDRIEDAGVLVVFNGIVGNNTRRKLDPDEIFRALRLLRIRSACVCEQRGLQGRTDIHVGP